MHKFSFKIKHHGCSETGLSARFPKHFITVLDIQSESRARKQYLYHIKGREKYFDAILRYLKDSKKYKNVSEVERSKDVLLVLVVLSQKGFVQNIIQTNHGFFLEPHTVFEGWEYWHVGVVERQQINSIQKALKKIGDVKTVSIGKIEFGHELLSKQQKNILTFALEHGYYGVPRKITIAEIAQACKVHPATAGEHLLKAENKLIKASLQKY